MADYYFCTKKKYFPKEEIISFVHKLIQESENGYVSFDEVFQKLREKYQVNIFRKESLHDFLEKNFDFDYHQRVHEKSEDLFDSPYHDLKEFFRAVLIQKFDQDIQIVFSCFSEDKLKDAMNYPDAFDHLYKEFCEKYTSIKKLKDSWREYAKKSIFGENYSILPFCSPELRNIFITLNVHTIKEFSALPETQITHFYLYSEEVISIWNFITKDFIMNFYHRFDAILYKHSLEIATFRLQGLTIPEISEKLGISITRVNKIDSSLKKNYQLLLENENHSFEHILAAMVKNPFEVSEDEIIHVFKEKAPIFTYLQKYCGYPGFSYYEDFHVYNLSNVAYLEAIKQETIHKGIAISNMEEIFLKSEWKEKYPSVSDDLLIQIENRIYTISNGYSFLTSSTLIERAKYVLDTFYPLGIHKSEFGEYVTRYHEIFGEEGITKRQFMVRFKDKILKENKKMDE